MPVSVHPNMTRTMVGDLGNADPGNEDISTTADPLHQSMLPFKVALVKKDSIAIVSSLRPDLTRTIGSSGMMQTPHLEAKEGDESPRRGKSVTHCTHECDTDHSNG